MTIDRVNQAAHLLLEARRSHRLLDALPVDFRPASTDEAYGVQDQLARVLGPIRGWKTGAPGPAEPAAFAPIFDLRSAPATLAGPEWRLFGIEGEIAFRMARDLPARDEPYARDEVRAAIDTVHPAVEVVESRFADFRAQDKLAVLADCTSNGALVIGAAAPWPRFDLAHPPARILIDGGIAAAASGNNGGDPLRLLTELANHAARRTGALRAGAVVTTGSVTGLVFAHAGATAVADFGAFGRVELRFGN